MNTFPLPEMGITALMFVITVFISYVIWHILFGKRFPLKDVEDSRKKTRNDCPLNEIMGYDFIQIKTVEHAHKNDNQNHTVTRVSKDLETPGLYATSKSHADRNAEESERINEPSQDEPDSDKEDEKIIVIENTEELFNQCKNLPWNDIDPSTIWNNIPDDFVDNLEPDNYSEDELAQQKEIYEYNDDMLKGIYQLQDYCKISDEQRDALLKVLEPSQEDPSEEDL